MPCDEAPTRYGTSRSRVKDQNHHMSPLSYPLPKKLQDCTTASQRQSCKKLMMQVPHDEVATRYGTTRSRVKDLQESAGKFALMVAAFCECLGWSDLDILISKFQVSPESIKLLSLACMLQ